jgi:hypothetical protein
MFNIHNAVLPTVRRFVLVAAALAALGFSVFSKGLQIRMSLGLWRRIKLWLRGAERVYRVLVCSECVWDLEGSLWASRLRSRAFANVNGQFMTCFVESNMRLGEQRCFSYSVLAQPGISARGRLGFKDGEQGRQLSGCQVMTLSCWLLSCRRRGAGNATLVIAEDWLLCGFGSTFFQIA